MIQGLRRFHVGDRLSEMAIFNNTDVDATSHLATSCDRVHDLTDQMITLALALGARSAWTQWDRRPWSDRD